MTFYSWSFSCRFVVCMFSGETNICQNAKNSFHHVWAKMNYYTAMIRGVIYSVCLSLYCFCSHMSDFLRATGWTATLELSNLKPTNPLWESCGFNFFTIAQQKLKRTWPVLTTHLPDFCFFVCLFGSFGSLYLSNTHWKTNRNARWHISCRNIFQYGFDLCQTLSLKLFYIHFQKMPSVCPLSDSMV